MRTFYSLFVAIRLYSCNSIRERNVRLKNVTIFIQDITQMAKMKTQVIFHFQEQ